MTLLSLLGLACDLRASPWTYPGIGAPGPGLLIGSHFHAVSLEPGCGLGESRLVEPPRGPGEGFGEGFGEGRASVDAVLRHERVAPVGRRTLVVAVGSNGAPDVIRRKFGLAGVSGVVPFVRAEVRGIAAGHSAHVSIPGFVAAAPFRSPAAVTAVVASWLDDAQLACLDVTERTYTRRPAPATRCALRIEGSGEEPADWWLYDSDRGVLASTPDSRARLGLLPQGELLAVLAGADPELAALLGGVDPMTVLPALAASERQRAQIREHLADRWAVASGLAGWG